MIVTARDLDQVITSAALAFKKKADDDRTIDLDRCVYDQTAGAVLIRDPKGHTIGGVGVSLVRTHTIWKKSTLASLTPKQLAQTGPGDPIIDHLVLRQLAGLGTKNYKEVLRQVRQHLDKMPTLARGTTDVTPTHARVVRAQREEAEALLNYVELAVRARRIEEGEALLTKSEQGFADIDADLGRFRD